MNRGVRVAGAKGCWHHKAWCGVELWIVLHVVVIVDEMLLWSEGHTQLVLVWDVEGFTSTMSKK